ncbi:MAG: VOC family protein [Motilibacteraceae bacterium]
MSLRTSPWPAGVPCWVDISVPDVERTKAFYTAVLGWSYAGGEPEFGGYLTAQARGAAAAGIGPRRDGAQADEPAAWTMYFAADDAAAVQADVERLGGTVVLPTMEVGPLGRMLLAMDPTGAPFGVWQAGEHIGAGVVNESGAFTWDDLRSPDPASARSFYGGLFGYRFGDVPGAGGDYQVFVLPDEQAPLGGMGGLVGPEGTPPHWVVYFGVADAVAAALAAEAAGGAVVMPPFETPFGRMAGLRDPDGALFWTVESAAQEHPDREG